MIITQSLNEKHFVTDAFYVQCVGLVCFSRTGIWTASDCSVDTTECRVSSDSDRCEEYYVTCACKHLSTYAVIIDIADGTVSFLFLQVLPYFVRQ